MQYAERYRLRITATTANFDIAKNTVIDRNGRRDTISIDRTKPAYVDPTSFSATPANPRATDTTTPMAPATLSTTPGSTITPTPATLPSNYGTPPLRSALAGSNPRTTRIGRSVRITTRFVECFYY
ncbi:unnamed protein product [Echinostoma caproni]|uniref:DWNN domain-containing protein n=1 Tax=Echinostoma caproni TaxID=27848 RepID=A0A183A3P0_9TREM|nr:unnamed protein product [Echinostoma caproni]